MGSLKQSGGREGEGKGRDAAIGLRSVGPKGEACVSRATPVRCNTKKERAEKKGGGGAPVHGWFRCESCGAHVAVVRSPLLLRIKGVPYFCIIDFCQLDAAQ